MNGNLFEQMFAGVEEGYVGVTCFRDKQPHTAFFDTKSLDQACNFALEQNQHGHNVYVSMKTFETIPTKGRGCASDPGYHSMAWVDLDYGIEGHKSASNPPTREAAMSLLEQFPLRPTLITFTGHGLQAFWCFDHPIDARTPEGVALAGSVIKRVQATLAHYSADRGWSMDNTADLARIMRVPGTVNWKDPKNPVQGAVLELNLDCRYSVDALLAACLPETKPAKRPAIKELSATSTVKDRAAISDGKIPVSSRNATLTSIAGTMRRRGMSAQAIAAALQAENEERCEEPLDDDEIERIAISVSRYEPTKTQADFVIEATGVLEQLLPQVSLEPSHAFSQDVVSALAVLSAFDQLAFSRVKSRIKTAVKAKVSMKELELAVRAAAGKLRSEWQAQQGEEARPQPVFPELGYEIQLPVGYSMNDSGISRSVRGVDLLIFPVPVALSRSFRNPHTGLEMVELIYKRGVQIRRVAAERSVVFSRNRVMELADNGFPVTSENAKDLVVFLSELERINQVPVVPCAASLGWVGEHILPWDSDSVYLDSRGFEETAAAFGRQGTLAAWIDLIRPVRDSLTGRLLLAAAYASSLVSVVGTRTSGVMLWGGSQAGKTAALKAAVSIYGHPDRLMLNMYATRVSLEQQATFLRHLPLFIDERQLAGNDQALEQLVYMISGGAGKGRGKKNGGVQARGSWENMALITGEYPISNESSAAGVRGRLLEINVTKVVENDDATRLHRELQGQFGLAGATFIQAVKTKREEIRGRYDEWLNRTTNAFPQLSGSHAALLALLGLADELAAVCVHDQPNQAAAEDAWRFIQEISKLVVTRADLDDAVRAKDWVISMYLENAHRFEAEEGRPDFEYGAMLPGVLQIAPSRLKNFLKEGGFNSARAKSDFVQRGWLKQFKDANGALTTTRYGQCGGRGAYKRGYWSYLAFPEWSLSPEEQDISGIRPAIPPGAMN